MALSVRQLLFDVIVIINLITHNYLIVHLIMQVIFNQLTVVCDTILIDGNYPQHNISLVTLLFSSDLCKENGYCKTVSLNIVDYCFTLDKFGIYFADFNLRGSLPTPKFRENWTTRKFSILRYLFGMQLGLSF